MSQPAPLLPGGAGGLLGEDSGMCQVLGEGPKRGHYLPFQKLNSSFINIGFMGQEGVIPSASLGEKGNLTWGRHKGLSANGSPAAVFEINGT